MKKFSNSDDRNSWIVYVATIASILVIFLLFVRTSENMNRSSKNEASDGTLIKASQAIIDVREGLGKDYTTCSLLDIFYPFLRASEPFGSGIDGIDRKLTLVEVHKILGLIRKAGPDEGLDGSILSEYFREVNSTNSVKRVKELTDQITFFDCQRALSTEADTQRAQESAINNADVIYPALRTGCHNLPTYLNVEFVGDGPKTKSGSSSTLYSVNNLLQVALFDVGDHWEVGAWPITDMTNRETASEWDCGAGGAAAVLGTYFVNK